MTVGFIGVGNMGKAILQGVLKSGKIAGNDIFISNYPPETAKVIADELKVNACATNKEVIEKSDITIVAVKPNILKAVLEEMDAKIFDQKKVIVSIAAGTDLEQLYSFLPKEAQSKKVSFIRVMPNMNATIGASASGICGNEYATKEEIGKVVEIFETVGKVWPISEKDFSAYAALAGCSPAYVYLFIDSIARAGVKNGIPKDLATEIVAQTVFGSAKMVLESEKSPWDIIDMVCSPGGTTVAGLAALEEEAFMGKVIKGIDAAIAKDIELNKGE